METAQNIIILILTLICTWFYFDKKDLKYWKDYYKQKLENSWIDRESLLEAFQKKEKHNQQILEIAYDLETKLNKAEEIISQQKQELLKTKKK